MRFTQYGQNKLRKGKRFSALFIFMSQFKRLVIWGLIGAAAVCVVLGETTDGIAIIAIVILNAMIGFIQECRAEMAAALAHLTAPYCRVVRVGCSIVIAATEVVPGDILLLEGGDLVAADARLIQASVPRTNELPLTCESQAVGKSTDRLASRNASGGAEQHSSPWNQRNRRFRSRIGSHLVITGLLRAFGAWSEQRTLWQITLFSNLHLFLVVAESFTLQLAIHHATCCRKRCSRSSRFL